MSSHKHAPRTAAQWEESFAAYNHSSGLTQQAFCEQHGISYSGFRHRYRNSEQFQGTRRRSAAEVAAGARAPGTSRAAASPSSAFRPVRTVSVSAPVQASMPAAAATVVVRVYDSIAVECLAGADPVVVATLVREILR